MPNHFTPDHLRSILTAAQTAAAKMAPGAIWLGGLPEAHRAGYTDPRDISLFANLYLDSLPRHSAIVTDQDNVFIRFE